MKGNLLRLAGEAGVDTTTTRTKTSTKARTTTEAVKTNSRVVRITSTSKSARWMTKAIKQCTIQTHHVAEVEVVVEDLEGTTSLHINETNATSHPSSNTTQIDWNRLIPPFSS